MFSLQFDVGVVLSACTMVMTETRDRWTTDRQVNRASVGSPDKLWQVITSRCSGGHVARKLDRECLQRNTSRRRLGVREAPRCSFWDRRLRGTELSLYPPVTVTAWDNTAAQERFGRNFWRAACGVVELTGIPRHYIPFQLPINQSTEASECLMIAVCNPKARCGQWVSFAWKRQTKLNWTNTNKIFFDSFPVQRFFYG